MPDTKKPAANTRVAVFAGTFDPLTNGHLDIIRRAAAMYDTLHVGVSHHGRKKTIFTLEQRIEAIREAAADLGNVQVVGFTSLLYQLVAELGAGVVVRGLRVTSDFDYEFQMAAINRHMGHFETVLLMARAEHTMISSSNVKEIAILGGDATAYVPPNVAKMLEKSYADIKSAYASRYAESQ